MKHELRKQYLKIRNEMAEEERSEKSKRIFQTLVEHKKYQSAKTVFLYKSIGSEVITDLMIEYSFSQGKKVAVPFIIKEKREMIFAHITPETNFIRNTFHIPEPQHITEISADEHTLVIVPGVVFDSECFRIGYGGGYYDRYLEKEKSVYTIGVCYREQMADRITVDFFDQKLNWIITD